MSLVRPVETDLGSAMREIGVAARAAAQVLAHASVDSKNGALRASAEAIRDHRVEILSANARDLDEAGHAQLSAAVVDRLILDQKRVVRPRPARRTQPLSSRNGRRLTPA